FNQGDLGASTSPTGYIVILCGQNELSSTRGEPHELPELRRVHGLRPAPRPEADIDRLRDVWADAGGALRSRARAGEREQGRAPATPSRDVPLPRAHAARRGRGARDAGRGGDALARAAAARGPPRDAQALGQGRGPEPHGLLQGARALPGEHAREV